MDPGAGNTESKRDPSPALLELLVLVVCVNADGCSVKQEQGGGGSTLEFGVGASMTPTEGVPELGEWEAIADKGNCLGRCPKGWKRGWHVEG